MEFQPFPKIPRFDRLFGRCIVTEKINGSNASIKLAWVDEVLQIIGVGSRKRWITPEKDNFGFAQFVQNNEEDILQLGEGHHFGEWFGSGIQSTYNLDEKRFALFNTRRWNEDNPNRPDCCTVVPELYGGEFNFKILKEITDALEKTGTHIEGHGLPYYPAEGVVVYLSEMDQMIKWTFANSAGKWFGEE